MPKIDWRFGDWEETNSLHSLSEDEIDKLKIEDISLAMIMKFIDTFLTMRKPIPIHLTKKLINEYQRKELDKLKENLKNGHKTLIWEKY